ncbi:Glycine cleavage system T protein [Planctomycetes bacterium Pla163]|uniref:Aminomethyltransferase n=1 Tax=Rohdeia mirabilis TaxID=2528008 RepID=A0A518CYV2_9BACT|nr:Glycine cleavage system T protein [Planctomycetes bacterium Pla163]
MSDQLARTVLFDVHVRAGARMVEFGGWSMPLQYGPILDEARRVRSTSGLFDLGHMGRLELRGADAVTFADRVLTCWVAKIPVGAIRYGLVCREDGNPIDDVLVYKGEDEVSVVVNASNRERVLGWFEEQRAPYEVEIVDHTLELGMIALQGPKAAEILARVTTGMDVAELGYYRFGEGTFAGLGPMRVSRTGYTGEDGFEFYVSQNEVEILWNALLEAGGDDVAPTGLGARDTLRLEAGMPLYGHEISDELNPIEAGLAFGVSLKPKKSGTLGFDALTAVAAAPRRALVGIETDGRRVPRQGHELFVGDERVGFVCSGTFSPTLDKPIASAYVDLGHSEPGTAVELDLRGKRQACSVRAMPFFSRTRS